MTTTTGIIPAKPGPPLGNQNAIRHGLRAGALPAGCRHIQRATDELRQALELATIKAKGAITITDAASINTACRSERHAALCQRWLRLEAATMDAATRLRYAESLLRASEQRDKAIRSLALETSAHDALVRQLYGKQRKPVGDLT